MKFYDYTRPWITRCSIQRTDLYKTAENTLEWRTRYGKPIVLDETAYEGNIAFGWDKTIVTAGTVSGRITLTLPGKAYIAVRFQSVEA